MSAQLIGPGLAIKSGSNVLIFLRQTADSIYFDNTVTGEIVTYGKREFFRQLDRGVIAVSHALVAPGEIQTKPEEGSSNNAPLSIAHLTPKHAQQLMRKIAYVTGVQQRGISRGKKYLIDEAIAEIAREIDDAKPPCVSSVCSWLKRYESHHHQPHVLASRHFNRKPYRRLDASQEQEIQDTLDEHYLSLASRSARGVYKTYQGIQESKKSTEICSLRTFYRRIKEVPAFDRDAARRGTQFARHRYRMLKGHLRADRPMQFVEVDSTWLDLFVIDDRTGQILGRPYLVIARDRATGMIVGLYLSFSGIGAAASLGILRHSLLLSKSIRECFPDIENDWLPFGQGDTYVLDNGSEFIAHSFRQAVLDLGSGYQRCRVATPWLKGCVERIFGVLGSDLLECLPGKTFPLLSGKRDYVAEKHAVVRFSTIVYALHKWILDHYHTTPHSRKLASPLDMWMDAADQHDLRPPHSTERLERILTLRHSGSLRHDGIQFATLHYVSEQANELRKRYGPAPRVEYHVQPQDLGRIWIVDPDSKQLIEAHATRPDYANGLSLFQHNLLRQEERKNGKARYSIDALAKRRVAFTQWVFNEISRTDNRQKQRIAKAFHPTSNEVIASQSTPLPLPTASSNHSADELLFADIRPFRSMLASGEPWLN